MKNSNARIVELRNPGRRTALSAVLGVFLASHFGVATAAPAPLPTTLAQESLLITPRPAANIFLTMDDSGSMVQERLPDDPPFTSTDLMFPSPWSNVYHPSSPTRWPNAYDPRSPDSTVRFQDFASGQVNVARARSSAQNLLYYNPTVRYLPWEGVDVNNQPFGPANPKRALYHPFHPSRGGLDLTATIIDATSIDAAAAGITIGSFESTGDVRNVDRGRSYDIGSPMAVYYLYNGGAVDSYASYTRVEIKPSVATYTIATPNGRDDCTTVTSGMTSTTTCTYEKELQNFANWFTYYRSRTLLARGAIGRAFVTLNDRFRVGFGRINEGQRTVDGATSQSTVILGVRKFDGAVTDSTTPSFRWRFYRELNDHRVSGTTPSRRALDHVGQYFERKDLRGPWGDDPERGTGTRLACRQSYHVYVTDGYWNTPGPTTPDVAANVDGNAAPADICKPGGVDCYRYDPTQQNYDPSDTLFGGSNSLSLQNNRRFKDTYDGTLADIAMYYWYRDLQDDVANLVPPSRDGQGRIVDPAFWQHLVQMTVALGLAGTRTGDQQGFLESLDKGTVTNWPDPNTGSPSSTGPERIDDLFHAAVNSRGRFFAANNPRALATQLANALQDIKDRVASGAQAAPTSDFLGPATAFFTVEFKEDGSGDLYRRERDPSQPKGYRVFDPSTGRDWDWRASDQLRPLVSADTRKIYTIQGSFADDPSSGTRVEFRWGQLDTAQRADVVSEDIANFVRGDQSKELPTGTLRKRPHALGAIMNSGPLYISSNDFSYDFLPASTAGRSSYLAFVRRNETAGGIGRKGPVFVNSNSGMLHAFDAANGTELFAYVPRSVLKNLPEWANAAAPQRLYLDGPVSFGDMYFNSAWHTVVVGTGGAGARAVFAVRAPNVNDAGAPEGMDASNVLWDFDENSTGVASAGGSYSGDTLGHVLSQVQIAPTQRTDEWAAIFGNGYESPNGTAALYVLDAKTGRPIRVIDTGVGGTGGKPNGLSGVTVWGDTSRRARFVYAGDLRGNLWKFDLSSADATQWRVANGGAPLMQARAPDGSEQPIYAAPLVIRHKNGGPMVVFGTGKLIANEDRTDAQVQTLYGVWDGPGITGGPPIGASFRSGTTLVKQSILEKAADGRYRLTKNAVNYTVNRGWYLDLGVLANGSAVTPRERSWLTPEINGDMIATAVSVPPTDPCGQDGGSMRLTLDVFSGGYFGTNEYAGIPIDLAVGQRILLTPRGTGRSRSVQYVTTGADGRIRVEELPASGVGDFRTWRQLLD